LLLVTCCNENPVQIDVRLGRDSMGLQSKILPFLWAHFEHLSINPRGFERCIAHRLHVVGIKHFCFVIDPIFQKTSHYSTTSTDSIL
jgi:hypothetical protein